MPGMDMAGARQSSKPSGVKGDSRFREQFRKTERCAYFERGCCAKGTACGYAHGPAELRRVPDLTKTSLCRKWLQFSCGHASAECAFAHGWHELRTTDAYARKPVARRAHGPSSGGGALGQPAGVDAAGSAHSEETPLLVPNASWTPLSPRVPGKLEEAEPDAPQAGVAAQQAGMLPMLPFVPVVFLNLMGPPLVAAPQPMPSAAAGSLERPSGEALAEILRKAMPLWYED